VKTWLAALVVALLAFSTVLLIVPAGGQGRKGPMSEPKQEAPKKVTDDKGYKSALDRMPEQKYDPWRDVREPAKTGPGTK